MWQAAGVAIRKRSNSEILEYGLLCLLSRELCVMDFFFEFAWEVCVEKLRDFGEFFMVSPSHETKHENSAENSKIRELSSCNCSDLTMDAM